MITPHNNFIHGLIDRWLNGTCTPEEKEQLHQYFSQYDLREEELKDDKMFHPAKDQSRRMYAQLAEKLAIDPPVRKIHFISIRRILNIAAAVIPLVMLIGGSYYLAKESKQPVETISEIRNKSKGILHVRLTDGSEIWLNENANLQLDTLDFKKHRNITLHGEAYFKVAQDPAHPFTVNSGKLRTTVLGTSFAIRRDTADAVVTLLTGKVSLKGGNNPARLLAPGQAAYYNELLDQLQIRSSSIYAMAWMTKEIICRNEPLENIIRYMEDYYGISITMHKAISHNRFSGTLSLKGDVSLVLDRLLFVHQLRHKRNKDNSIDIY